MFIFVGCVAPPALTLWADPERTMRVDVNSLPPELQALAKNTSDHKRLLAGVVKAPEDWRVHMILRAEITRSSDSAFAKEATSVVERNMLKYMPGYPHWYRRQNFYQGLCIACFSLTLRGELNVDRNLRFLWLSNGQRVLARMEDFKSVEETFLPLSYYRQDPFRAEKGRAFLAAARKKFGYSVGLAAYTARLYYTAVSPNGNINAVKDDPDRVRDASLYILSSGTKDPGALAVATTHLMYTAHPKAFEAYRLYKASRDPEADRRVKVDEISTHPGKAFLPPKTG